MILFGRNDMLCDTSWEMLGEKLSICVSPVHKFGTDAFLLSDFAFPRRKDLCCDLGTGCGIIPMLWFRGEDGPKKAFAVDIQPKAIEQLNETVRQNGLDDRLIPVLADLKDLVVRIDPNAFIIVQDAHQVLGDGFARHSEDAL